MFKPTLKRSKLDESLQISYPIHNQIYKPAHPKYPVLLTQKPSQIHYHRTIKQHSQPQKSLPLSILPRKMLQENPYGFYQPKSILTSPLSSNFYDYPQAVKKQLHIDKNQNLQQRGIGHYNGIFWFYRNNKLFLWHYLDQMPSNYQQQKIHNPSSYKKVGKLKQIQFDLPIFTIAIGDLKKLNQNIFQKSQILLLAIGFSSYIHLYAIDEVLGLKIKRLDISIKTDTSHTNQKIIITKNNQIFFGGSYRYLSMYTLNANKPLKVSSLSFYQKAFGLLTFRGRNSLQDIQEIVTSNNKVYCLVQKPIFSGKCFCKWMKKCLNRCWNKVNCFSNKKIISQSFKCIDVYQIGQKNTFRFLHTIQQKEVEDKIKNNYSEFAGNKQKNKHLNNELKLDDNTFEFKSIFIDQKTQFLGISIKCGYFLIIKDTQNITFWKQPYQIRKVPSKIGLDIPYQVDNSKYINKNNHYQVFASKGYNNLTLLKNLIVYVDDNRFYLLKCSLKKGQIFQISEASYDPNKFPLLQPHRKWILFQMNGFEVITKPQPRDFILSYISFKSFEQEQVYKQNKGSKKYISQVANNINRLGYNYGYSEFCTYLLQLLMLNNYSVRLNRQFQEFIKNDINKKQKINFQQWCTINTYRQGQQDTVYKMTPQIQQEVWKYLIQSQSYPIKLSSQILEIRKQSSKENPNALWFAVRFFLFKIVQDILQWSPAKFLMNPNIVKITILRLKKYREILLRRMQKIIQYLFPQKCIIAEKAYKQNQVLHQTMQQSLNQTIQQKEKYTTNSTATLIQIIMQAIPKILQIIQIYQRLGEIDKLQQSQFSKMHQNQINQQKNTAFEEFNFGFKKSLPKFVQIMFNNPSRKILKQAVIKYLKGPQIKNILLQKIKENLPELQLGLDLSYINWRENNMKRVSPQDVDVKKLAIIITFPQYLLQLKDYFKLCPDRYLELLIQKIKQFQRQDYQLRIRSDIYSNQNYFQRQEKKLFGQNRYALDLEIMAYQEQIKIFLKQIIETEWKVEPYQPTSRVLYQNIVDPKRYQKQKRKISNQKILKLVAQNCSAQIKKYCQQLLRKSNLFDYIVLFKKFEPIQDFGDEQPYKHVQMRLQQKNSSKFNNKMKFYDGREGLVVLEKQKKIQQMTTTQAAQFLLKKQKQQKMGKSLFLDMIDLQQSQLQNESKSKTLKFSTQQKNKNMRMQVQQSEATIKRVKNNNQYQNENEESEKQTIRDQKYDHNKSDVNSTKERFWPFRRL